jgi:hypothetical protein
MMTFLMAVSLGATMLFSVLVTTPPAAYAKERETRTSMGAGESPRHALLQHHIKRLQKYLPVGHTESFYRDRLADRGWRITAVNQDEPMYIEYEIVRGDLTAEVQMKLDRETDQTIQVAVLENPILREATEIALAQNLRRAQLTEAEGAATETIPWRDTAKEHQPSVSSGHSEMTHHRPAQWGMSSHADRTFSDRDRIRIEQVIEDVASLPLGQRRGFYRSALEQQGYKILAVRRVPRNQVQYRAVKHQQPVLLTVMFDNNMNNSVALSAIPGNRTDGQTTRVTQIEREEQENK